MIPKLCWVQRGVAKENPDILKLDSDELAGLIASTKANLEIAEDDIGSEGEEVSEKKEGTENKVEMEDKDTKDEIADEFNMANYDDEEEDEAVSQRMFGAGLSGVAYFANPEDDPYITLPQVAREEEETYEVKPTDNLICCAKLDGNMSTIEVHLWNGEEGNYFVHHDIILDTFPLSIEWLSYDAGYDEVDTVRQPGNYVALGCMSPQIELWDLDIIDTSEPVATLGERRKQSKKIPKIGKKGHSDAVMDLSWNKHTQNVLASASADKHVLLWDLESNSAKECLAHHTDKVASS